MGDGEDRFDGFESSLSMDLPTLCVDNAVAVFGLSDVPHLSRGGR